jgi:bacteriorhodopsin
MHTDLTRSNIINIKECEARSMLLMVMCLMLVLWSLFPVVWLLAELHLISPASEQLCWGLCDYAAKVGLRMLRFC